METKKTRRKDGGREIGRRRKKWKQEQQKQTQNFIRREKKRKKPNCNRRTKVEIESRKKEEENMNKSVKLTAPNVAQGGNIFRISNKVFNYNRTDKSITVEAKRILALKNRKALTRRQ